MIRKNIVILAILVLFFSASLLGEAPQDNNKNYQEYEFYDNNTYIDANLILMFVTNHGNFGRDLSGVFGYDYGTWYPYSGNIYDIINNTNGAAAKSPLYAAGIWLGGKVNNEVLVATSEYSSEYVPGPMENGTYMNDRPEFKVYKLYSDSLESNPNNDYLNWPTDQDAPTDYFNNPQMTGDQMLWTVFNDASPSRHQNFGTDPLGIEIQQTVFASSEDGSEIVYVPSPELIVTGPENSKIEVVTELVDENAYSGKDYSVIIENIEGLGTVWKVLNVTDDIVMIDNQPVLSVFDDFPVIDGYMIKVYYGISAFESFEVVANANGPIDPPVSGAFASKGFPTPGNSNPGDEQQAGPAKWAFHTGDNGGTNGGGDRDDYSSFIFRTFRLDPSRFANLGDYDWEMRFTGSYDNPGVGGSYAWDAFLTGESYWVPFELWRTGMNTPNDPSDDLRLIPWIIGEENNMVYNLSSYGSELSGNCGPSGFYSTSCEHSASDGDDDPFTDWVYWAIPADEQGNLIETPGEVAYQVFEQAMKNDPTSWPGYERRVIERTVLINWDAGEQPPFEQELPEKGTVFRLVTKKSNYPAEFTFSQTLTPSIQNDLAVNEVVYIKYKLYNKGSNNIDDMYISLWVDPDLGSAADDMVGCDTLDDIFYCYNSTNNDVKYGANPPALGFKIINGPLVPSPGDIAFFDGSTIGGYRNLGMTSFQKYRNSTDPDDAQEIYNYMQGLNADGTDYTYYGQVLKYVNSGDPTTGSGDLDLTPTDQRMMASFGPFDFNPGDSQYVLIKMAVSQGVNNLNSITEVKTALNGITANCVDSDNDGLGDPGYPGNTCEEDKCPIIFDPSNTDSDGDGIGDACTFVEFTNPGSLINHSIGPNVELTFDNVITGCETELTISTSGPELPAWYSPLTKNFPLYYNLSTCAQFSDNVKIRITYDDSDLTWEEENDLVLLHFDGFEWVDITTLSDTYFNNTITGISNEFSPFVVAIQTGSPIICGDVNGDTYVNLNDVEFLKSTYFECGPEPENIESGDMNCNGKIDFADIIILVEYISNNLSDPCCD